MQNLLNSEFALSFAASIVALFWTVFKSSDWLHKRRERRFADALQVLEAAVEDTYRTYVQAIKEARADGKLTAEERAKARMLAKCKAFAIAKTQGVDLLRDIGQAFLDLWIGRLVHRLKRF